MDRRQGGQASVELVLTLPVVVLSLLLVIQVGLVVRAQVLVVDAAREGARSAAIEGTAAAAGAGARSTPGLDARRLDVDARIPVEPGAIATVRVSYRLATDVPLVGRLLGDPQLTAQVSMRVEGTSSIPPPSSEPGSG